jgi:hypothetical protein
MQRYEDVETLYRNPLASAEDLRDWRMEGPGVCSFPRGLLRMESAGELDVNDKSQTQAANLVCWRPETFPDQIRFSWTFRPLREPGLAILFFAAKGQQGEHVLDARLDARLPARHGPNDQYHHGAIHALHVSYFRRRLPDEIALHTCNLRKSYGFHLVCQGADPLPAARYASLQPPYQIWLVKDGPVVQFGIAQLTLFQGEDDGQAYWNPTLPHADFRTPHATRCTPTMTSAPNRRTAPG